MNRKVNFIKFISIVVSYLFLSSLAILYTVDADGHLEISYDISYEMNSQNALITISKNDIQNYKVTKLLFEGEDINLNDPRIRVEENGVYKLFITYKEDDTVIETMQEVQVNNIKKQTANRSFTGLGLVPDVNFYNYLVFEKGLDSEFTIADLKALDSVYYIENDPSKRIHDLSGIEYMTSLRYIYLNDQDITSLEPMRSAVYPYLSQMEFNNWNTGTNAIHDFSILTATRFPSLDDQIMFNNNGVSDEHLQTLPITDCLPEAVFHFQKNDITDIRVFAYYKDAKRLILNHNHIEDLTPLSQLNNIHILQLSNNNISDISPLSTITPRPDAAIWLNNNHITDLSPLGNVNAVIYARHNSDADPYRDPQNNQGQKYTNTTALIGDKESGRVRVSSIAKNRDGETIPMSINGQNYTSIDLTLDPSTDTEYTYYLEYYGNNTWYIGEVIQPIIWWDKPTFMATELELYVGDAYDLMSDVKAYDTLGNDISTKIMMESTNVNIQEAGTYQATYSIEDDEGYTSTYQRKIKVHGLPVVEVNSQKYEINNANINHSLMQRSDAYWLEAQDSIGDKPKKVEINETGMNYQIIAGDNRNFSSVGIYKVRYEATNSAGRKGTKDIQVLITNKHSVMDSLSNLLIGADNLQFTYEEMQSLSKAQVIQRSNVRAFLMKRNIDGKVSGFEEISSKTMIHEEQWKEIKNVSPQGGIFELLYTVKTNNQEVSKKIIVTVLGDNTYPLDSKNEIIISGKNIHLSYNEAKSLNQENAIKEAELIIYNTIDNKLDTKDVKVNEKQLDEINRVSKQGGTFKLTFTAMYQDTLGQNIEGNLSVDVIVDKEKEMTNTDRKQLVKDNNSQRKASISAGDETYELITYSFILLLISGYICGCLWKKTKSHKF